MTTIEQARKHFKEVVHSLSIQEFERLERMNAQAKAVFIADRWQQRKRQEAQALKDKLRSARGNAARTIRDALLKVIREVYE